MQNYWWILAIALSLLTSAYVYVNQFVKIKGSLLMVYRGLGTAAVLLPFVFCFAPIHNWAFYALCAAQGLVISLGDNRILNGAKTFGAQVTSLIHPLSIALIFVFWMLLHPADFAALGREPLHLLLILACLLGTTAALILICRAKASRKALGFLLVGMFCEIFIDVTNKETTHLGAENLVSAIYYYTLITSLVAGSVNLAVHLGKGHHLPEFWSRKNLRFAWFFMLFAIVHGMLKTYTMYLTPNPAYVAAIVHAYPVWILLFNGFQRENNYIKIKPQLILLLLISIVGLIFLTGHQH